MVTINTLGMLSTQKYERYLPTAFDESLTLLEKLNKVIKSYNDLSVTFNNTLSLMADIKEEQDLKIADLQEQINQLKG